MRANARKMNIKTSRVCNATCPEYTLRSDEQKSRSTKPPTARCWFYRRPPAPPKKQNKEDAAFTERLTNQKRAEADHATDDDARVMHGAPP